MSQQKSEFGLLLDPSHGWADPEDPDMKATLFCPDLLGFPNPARVPHHYVPVWANFAPGGALKPMDSPTLNAILDATEPRVRNALYGLSPWEFIHRDHLRVFFVDVAVLDVTPRRTITLAYPVWGPTPGQIVLMHSSYSVAEGLFSYGKIKTFPIRDAVAVALTNLVQKFLAACNFPSPPACNVEGCFQFARFKWRSLAGMQVRCVEHVHSGHLVSDNMPLPIKLWALHQLHKKGDPETQQLSF